MADAAVKQGMQEPSISIKIDIPISETEIANWLKHQIYNKLQLRWALSPEYKYSKNFLTSPDSNRTI